MDSPIDEIVAFWFRGSPEDPQAMESRASVWFRADPNFDEEIRARFGAEHDAASRGERAAWRRTPRTPAEEAYLSTGANSYGQAPGR